MDKDQSSESNRLVELLLGGIATGFLAVTTDSLLKGEYVRAGIALAVGVLLSIILARWAWVKTKIGPKASKSAQSTASDARTWLVLLLLLFVYLGREGFRESVWNFWYYSTHVRPIASSGETKAPPIPVSEIVEASIKLQFNGSGAEPQEIASSNTTWKKISLKETYSTKCVSVLGLLGQPGGYYGQPVTGQPDCYNAPQDLNSFILILIFNKRVNHKKILVDSHGGQISKWDNAFMNGNFAVLYFHGEVLNVVLDIRPVD
jgi:hypothetical protein